MQLWEDLCSLEGRLGIRYVTHESEDNFWQRQGAKPHPLTKSTPKITTTNYYVNIHTIHEHMAATEHDSMTHSQQSSKNGSVPSASATVKSQTQFKPTTTSTIVSPTKNRKSYVDMEDEDVEKLQKHAERVGYTVSTV